VSDEQSKKPGIERPADVTPYDVVQPETPTPPSPLPPPSQHLGIPVGIPVDKPIEKPVAKPTANPLGESLIAQFDEDADFSKDPEVERALSGGKPIKGTEPLVETPPPPPPLVKEGLGDASSVALVSCGLLLGAVIVACVNATGPWYKAGIAAIYLTVLQSACGVAALGVEAFLNKRPLGPLDLAAARMLGIVALFIFILRLNLPIPGNFDEPVFAALGYFGAMMLLFRFTARTASHVAIIHAILAITTWGILSLHSWVVHVPPQTPVTP
jgi:hypothetical protein